MKTSPLLLLILLMVISGSFMISTDLVFTCDRYTTTFRQNLKVEEVPSLRNRMESLIKSGSIPLVIESKNDVAWIYLNDPEGRDYPEVNFESDYFEIITELFPLKLTNKLKKSLKKGNKEFMKTLGVEYVIENEEVISKINYDLFERFMFGKNNLKKLTIYSQLFYKINTRN